MTIGYYAIPPATSPRKAPKREPWPFCRACAAKPGMVPVVPIDETAHPPTTCRGCRKRVREWR